MFSIKECAAGAALAVAALVPSMASAFSTSHTGNANPLTEGFSTYSFSGGASIVPVTNDLGRDSWQMSAVSTSAQFGHTSGAFSQAEKLGISTTGFSLSFEARVLQGVASSIYTNANPYVIAAAVIDNGIRRFEVSLGLNANGDTVVALPSSINNAGAGDRISAPGPSFTLTGQGNGYHKYDLTYTPADQASLYIDGALVASGYSGYNNFLGNYGLGFFVFSGGVARYSAVSANISPVPEPTAASFMLLGLSIAALARWRKQIDRNA